MKSPSAQHPSDWREGAPSVVFHSKLPAIAKPLFPAPLLGLLGKLSARYRPQVDGLLAERHRRQASWNAGELPGFDPDTQGIREDDWQVERIPEPLRDRRVEITGPVDRKMIINALNSGAKVFMADFEDSSSPTFENMIHGQVNLYDATRRTIELTTPEGKHYQLNGPSATLIVRPRGWHLDEAHVTVKGQPIPAGIFDAAVYVYNNAETLIGQGLGPYLYLPKMESWQEAALWESVLTDIEKALQLHPGTIKVTVLIETLPAVFQMHEILHALKTRIVGLNCGRWDYIFSYIKCLQAHPDRRLPDRAQVTMGVPFLKAYSELLIQTCHRRGAFAMGGMAAQIPIKGDEEANRQALEKVRLDKEREAKAGHDGTWVAHPGLIPIALEAFDPYIKKRNQLSVLREDVKVTSEDLLRPCAGTITEAGVRGNLSVAIGYMAAWYRGQGCVPLNHLMEDAATAEIARAQVWQWIHHPGTVLDDGRALDGPLVAAWMAEEVATLKETFGDEGFVEQGYAAAVELIEAVIFDENFVEFLTLPGYARLTHNT
ncbi:MAG TPA: malate synthase A [Wenzhouxiangella sp.]